MKKLLLTLAALLLATTAFAVTSTQVPFQVSLTVEAICHVQTASDIPFGLVPADHPAPVTAPFSVTLDCTAGTSYTVALDDGGNASGGFRRMADGFGNFIAYSIPNPDGGGEWGDGVGGVGPRTSVVRIGLGSAVVHPAITTTAAVILPALDFVPNAYTDSVNAWIDF